MATEWCGVWALDGRGSRAPCRPASQVSVLYTAAPVPPPPEAPPPAAAGQPPAPAPAPSARPGLLPGRRLPLPLTFHMRSALRVTSTTFGQVRVPTRGGRACRALQLPPPWCSPCLLTRARTGQRPRRRACRAGRSVTARRQGAGAACRPWTRQPSMRWTCGGSGGVSHWAVACTRGALARAAAGPAARAPAAAAPPRAPALPRASALGAPAPQPPLPAAARAAARAAAGQALTSTQGLVVPAGAARLPPCQAAPKPQQPLLFLPQCSGWAWRASACCRWAWPTRAPSALRFGLRRRTRRAWAPWACVQELRSPLCR